MPEPKPKPDLAADSNSRKYPSLVPIPKPGANPQGPQLWACSNDCGFSHPEYDVVVAHEARCGTQVGLGLGPIARARGRGHMRTVWAPRG